MGELAKKIKNHINNNISYFVTLFIMCLILTACGQTYDDTESKTTSFIQSQDNVKDDSTDVNEGADVGTSNLTGEETTESQNGDSIGEETTANQNGASTGSGITSISSVFDINSIPPYSGSTYYVVNNNIPTFTTSEITTTSFEYYGNLDSLGRCTTCVACVGKDIMPTEQRGDISSVKPTGWHSVRYDNVDGGSLYNRSHLIGFQLTGENANKNNLITGTRYMNAVGMLPFENMIADYVKETNNHVMYRVTPVFEGNNLIASGVHMEAYSVEDDGDGICFNVYCYNVQPGININYATGDSSLATSIEGQATQPQTTVAPNTNVQNVAGSNYILNTNTKKFHYPDCSSVGRMSERNKQEYFGTRDEIISMGYDPCGNCNP